ncbi:DNA helicase-2 / ATP-dependent DNA helicase PcrA [Lachnospiraceae bacterium]|nr:DNA helicase-2 / ATP-dependent DNA helicase PcrA [Lachnospiraceae bacterium]
MAMNLDEELNKEQAEAVRQTEGPVLILAGAGSGKTRTIVYRMSYLLSEMGVRPWNILALTFTNKAAREMRDRIGAMVPDAARDMWVSTFHSTCLKILFAHAEKLGYPKNFEIADTADQKSIMRDVYKKLSVDPKVFPEKKVMRVISSAKDELMGPDEFANAHQGDMSLLKIMEIYHAYQKALKANGSMDFDDLILNTVRLFKHFPDVLDHYQEKFRYIMVDEYQDTNTAQFELVRLLASKYRNLCVVGDDDQSIYRFRGANIYNILSFEDTYPDAKVIKLEQNYRSTGNILAAANEVIANNKERKKKVLRTDAEPGSLIRFRQLDTAGGEAVFIADDIRKKVEKGEFSFGDCAVLIRTNVQSKELEDAFRVRRIDYDVVKGLRFWDTKVIKDLTSYLLTVAGGANDMRTLRIINLPKRGIGAASVEKARVYAEENGMSFLEACGKADVIPGVSAKAKTGFLGFFEMVKGIREDMKDAKFSEILDRIIKDTGYNDYLMSEADTTDKYLEFIDYINKLKESLDSYEEDADEPDLVDFMRQNGLEGNNVDKTGEGESKDRVLVMTMHNAKGLEFPNVYVAGMEEGLFPGYASIGSEDPMAMEEERRLCYVAITRAKKSLTMSCARQRMTNGETRYAAASRFMKEIPTDLLDMNVHPKKTERTEHMEPTSRQIAKAAFNEKPQAFSAGFQKIKLGKDIGGTKPDYVEGDRVRHFKFGEGTVQKIVQGGRDYEVTVNFDNAGVRKMFAGFAKLKKV